MAKAKATSSKLSEKPEQAAATPQRAIRSLPVNAIDMGNRLRPIDPDRAAFLAASIEASRLMKPIEVRPSPDDETRFVVVSGGHRLSAHLLLRREMIDAIVEPLTEEEARRREIDENIFSVDLTELDRAVFFKARKDLYEAEHPETRHGGDRKSDQVAIFGNLIGRFTAEVQEKLKISERTVYRIVARAAIDDAVRAKIAFTPLANKGAELDALVRLTADEQRKAVDLVLSGVDDAPKTISAASKLVRNVRVKVSKPEKDRDFEAFVRFWTKKAKAETKQSILDYLETQGFVRLPNAESVAA